MKTNILLASLLGMALSLGTVACGDDPVCSEPVNEVPGPTMRPGQNCLRCHDGMGEPTAPVFTAAGTVFDSQMGAYCEGVEGATLTFVAEDGSDLVLTTNSVGNFYTTEPIQAVGPTLEYEGRTISMQRELPPVAACNACHSNPPVGGAPGTIFVP